MKREFQIDEFFSCLDFCGQSAAHRVYANMTSFGLCFLRRVLFLVFWSLKFHSSATDVAVLRGYVWQIVRFEHGAGEKKSGRLKN